MGTVIVGIIVLAIAGGEHTVCIVTRKTENRNAAGIAAVVADTAIRNFAENRSRNEV